MCSRIILRYPRLPANMDTKGKSVEDNREGVVEEPPKANAKSKRFRITKKSSPSGLEERRVRKTCSHVSNDNVRCQTQCRSGSTWCSRHGGGRCATPGCKLRAIKDKLCQWHCGGEPEDPDEPLPEPVPSLIPDWCSDCGEQTQTHACMACLGLVFCQRCAEKARRRARDDGVSISCGLCKKNAGLVKLIRKDYAVVIINYEKLSSFDTFKSRKLMLEDAERL
jgi:hypothetical protein